MVFRRKIYKRPLRRTGRRLKMNPAFAGWVAGQAVRTVAPYVTRRAVVGTAAGLGATSLGANYVASRNVRPYNPIAAQKGYNAAKGVSKTSDRNQEDLGTGGDQTRSSTVFRIGRKRRAPRDKLVRANEQPVWNTWQGIQPFLNTASAPFNAHGTGSVGAGAYWLYNYTSNNITYMPCHLYDLTSTNNVINGTITNMNPSYEMTQNSSGNFAWVNMLCSTASGGAGSNWQPLNTPGSITGGANYPNRRSLLDSVSVKMYCYGSSSNAVQWNVSAIQLKEDTMAPYESVNGELTLTGRELTEKDAFYTYLVSKQSAHPIAAQDPNHRKNYKILKSFTFTTQPALTTETEKLPHQKELNIWIPMNRIQKYDWQQSAVSVGAATNPYRFGSNVGTVSTVVHPRARIYLMVTATNCTQVTSPTVPTYGLTPSYDLRIVQKQVIVE